MERNNVDYFPVWNPQRGTIHKIKNLDKKRSFKVFRSSSSGFIKRTDVRMYLLNKYNDECVLCNSETNLQVDHILSVFAHFKDSAFGECNLESNLQILCRKCNASKLP